MEIGSRVIHGGGGSISQEQVDQKVLDYINRAYQLIKKSDLQHTENHHQYDTAILELAKMIQLEELNK